MWFVIKLYRLITWWTQGWRSPSLFLHNYYSNDNSVPLRRHECKSKRWFQSQNDVRTAQWRTIIHRTQFNRFTFFSFFSFPFFFIPSFIFCIIFCFVYASFSWPSPCPRGRSSPPTSLSLSLSLCMCVCVCLVGLRFLKLLQTLAKVGNYLTSKGGGVRWEGE